MRSITFDKMQHELEYKLLYDALVTKEQGYTPAELRKLNKVLDKLEPLGKPIERSAGKNPVTTYELAQSGVVTLEDAEYEFVNKVMEGTNWVGLHSRKVASLLDMFEQASRTT